MKVAAAEPLERHCKHYRDQLSSALATFQEWCSGAGKPALAEICSDSYVVCQLLVEFGRVQRLLTPSKTKVFKHAVLAMQTLFRRLKGHLPDAWDEVKLWEARLPQRMRTPSHRSLAWALFVEALALGFVHDCSNAAQWITVGIGILVCFEGLLRPFELTNLRRRAVGLPSEGFALLQRGVRPAILVIEKAKNAKAMGRTQMSTIHHHVIVRWLTWICQGLPADARIFVSTTVKFR